MITRTVILSTEYLTEHRSRRFAYMTPSLILGLVGVIYRSRHGNFFNPTGIDGRNLAGDKNSPLSPSLSFSSLQLST